MHRLLRFSLICAVWGAIGCASNEANEMTYLRSAQDKATQEEVKQRLGSPAIVKSSQTGSTWVYQMREQQPGNRMTPPGMWCDEYVLDFDSRAILRRWNHRSYFHGGEIMPTECVPGQNRS
ncbi:MAG: hypothetical protein ACT4OO_13650 [Nitrospiraceae bacterium]